MDSRLRIDGQCRIQSPGKGPPIQRYLSSPEIAPEDSREMRLPHKTLLREQPVSTRGSQESPGEEVPARHLFRRPGHEHSSSRSIPPKDLRLERCLSSPVSV